MKSRVPETYDEITRRTVLDPDGSIRPPPEGAPSERTDLELRGAVADALLAAGLSDVGLEVQRGEVILRGWVRDADHAAHVVRVVASVAPGVEISDRLHKGHPA